MGFNGAALADFDEEDIRKLFLAGIEILGGVAKLVKKDMRKDKTHETVMAAPINRAREHEQKKRDVAGFEPSLPAAKALVVGSVQRRMASLEIELHSGVSEGQKPPSDDREASEPRQGKQPHRYRCGEKGHKMVDCHMTEDEARQRKRGDGLRSRALQSGTGQRVETPKQTGSLVPCHDCGAYGHTKMECPKPRQGNAQALSCWSIASAPMARFGDSDGQVRFKRTVWATPSLLIGRANRGYICR